MAVTGECLGDAQQHIAPLMDKCGEFPLRRPTHDTPPALSDAGDREKFASLGQRSDQRHRQW
ncbi:hypothetical protein Pen02_39880 [Plantactinospora endophytica]|uniref:Uncharacterized protein n=1 Tax=Plantactinospora endophytica TaxID=673535 RepID=A0ABQ4E300_9ACTN|nr:hypothetical protein Pen02_39880 [Plantactinospora endophytica]